MTNLKPITSEEVLEREVRENSMAAAERANVSKQNEEIKVAPALNAASNTPPSLKLEPSKQLIKSDKKFSYRLPLGSYLLAAIYIAVALYFLSAIAKYSLYYMQYQSTLEKIISKSSASSSSVWDIFTTYPEIWALIIGSGLLAIFILSGRKIFKFLAIVICLGGSIYLAYQLINTLASVTQAPQYELSVLQVLPMFINTVLSNTVLGILLGVVTIIYLLGTRVSTAYK